MVGGKIGLLIGVETEGPGHGPLLRARGVCSEGIAGGLYLALGVTESVLLDGRLFRLE